MLYFAKASDHLVGLGTAYFIPSRLGPGVSMSRRVLVTGLGAVTPLGNNVPATWQALLAGRSGVDFVTLFDGSGFPEKPIAGEVKGFEPPPVMPAKELRYMDRFAQFAAAAALEAVTDSG